MQFRNQSIHLRKLVTLALLGAIAYVLTAFVRIPMVMFLKYDPKDIILALTGFIFGPLEAVGVTVAVASIEMITVSDTGIWGLLMNIISSVSFVLPAVLIYKRKRTMMTAVIGLVFSVIIATATMLLWNALVTPFYMGQPREAVISLLLPAFLPFNLFKSSINAILTFLLYRPVSDALVRSGILQKETSGKQQNNWRLVPIIALLLLCLMIVLVILYSVVC